MFYAGGEAINFIKQAHSFGLSNVMKVTGAGWTTSPLFLPAQKEAAIGFIGSLNYVPSINTEANKLFITSYKNKFGRIPVYFTLRVEILSVTLKFVVSPLSLLEIDPISTNPPSLKFVFGVIFFS